ncbi:unnamed protein product [Penicillium viridicatum]
MNRSEMRLRLEKDILVPQIFSLLPSTNIHNDLLSSWFSFPSPTHKQEEQPSHCGETTASSSDSDDVPLPTNNIQSPKLKREQESYHCGETTASGSGSSYVPQPPRITEPRIKQEDETSVDNYVTEDISNLMPSKRCLSVPLSSDNSSNMMPSREIRPTSNIPSTPDFLPIDPAPFFVKTSSALLAEDALPYNVPSFITVSDLNDVPVDILHEENYITDYWKPLRSVQT